MESLVIDIKNFADQETKHKKVKIRTVQGYGYGMLLHVLKGRFLNAVPAPGGLNINLELNGSKLIYMRTVFDRTGAFDPKDLVEGQETELLAAPVLLYRNETVVCNYEFVPGNDYTQITDRSRQPIPITFKDFDLRGWDMGLQTVPVSASPYRSSGGKLGINYVASSAGDSRFISKSAPVRRLTDRFSNDGKSDEKQPF